MQSLFRSLLGFFPNIISWQEPTTVPLTNEEIVPLTNEEIVPLTNEEIVPLTNEEIEPLTNEELTPPQVETLSEELSPPQAETLPEELTPPQVETLPEELTPLGIDDILHPVVVPEDFVTIPAEADWIPTVEVANIPATDTPVASADDVIIIPAEPVATQVSKLTPDQRLHMMLLLSKHTRNQLVELCSKQGIAKTGNKEALAERLAIRY